MKNLTLNDTQSLHQAIQKIYALHDLDQFGLDSLTILNQLVPSEVPQFHVTQPQPHQFSYLFPADVPRLSPVLEQVMNQHWNEHPLIQNMPRVLDGAYKISDFISEQDLYQLEVLYQQVLYSFACEDQMTFFLPVPSSDSWYNWLQVDAVLTGFSLHRSQRNFTERDRLILNYLRPHLAQAYANVQHYQQIQQSLTQLQQSFNCLGLVILDTEGRVESIAPQATAWLETYFANSTSARQLPEHLWSWVKYQINGLTQSSDLPEPCSPLRIQLADRELIIRLVIESVGDRYLLLLNEQPLSLSQSLDVLGLSQRETEMLNWVIQGQDNKTIAAQTGVTPATVRKHLENIYRKLGVTSRTEAIAQTLKKLGLLN